MNSWPTQITLNGEEERFGQMKNFIWVNRGGMGVVNTIKIQYMKLSNK